MHFFNPSNIYKVEGENGGGLGNTDAGAKAGAAELVRAITLPMGKKVDFGAGDAVVGGCHGNAAGGGDHAALLQPYRFLSIFKFEPRKGWDVLLAAFIQEFAVYDAAVAGATASKDAGAGDAGGGGGGGDTNGGGAADDASGAGGDCGRADSRTLPELYILTSSFHTDNNMVQRVRKYIQDVLLNTSNAHHDQHTLKRLPNVYVIDEHVAQRDLPALYAAADCFVLPSRGEGWGRPHVEAMSMGLPVIATNWSGRWSRLFNFTLSQPFITLIEKRAPRLDRAFCSQGPLGAGRVLTIACYIDVPCMDSPGPTAYMTESNSYPLTINGLVPIKTGPFRLHHRWADPSKAHLQTLMREVVNNPERAKEKGVRARQDMIQNFAPNIVAAEVEQHLKRIAAKLKEEGDL